ncbi:MAG: hypothetical protein H0U30_03735 [Actinobacteria bacterium]|nr:hypothetical protein [Actinomycetota bacterium]
MLVEYASLVAAMAVLTASLTGAFGQKLSVLPTSGGAAISTLNAAAGAQKVPAGGARTAYKNAPYSKPVLRYLYAVGWIGGKKSPLSCLFARTQPTETEQEALTEIKGNGKLVKQLRRVHVGQKQAASVVVKGIASACS